MSAPDKTPAPDEDLDEDGEDGEDEGQPEDAGADEGAAEPELGRRRRRRLKKPRKRLSDILREIVDDGDSSHITVGDLLRRMDGRAFGALLLIFAFPNVLPAPPGLAAFLGLPLLYLSSQMMLGRMPWLPPFIDNRSLSRENFRALIERGKPILARVEKLLAERLSALTSAPAERILGALCLILSLVLMLPIPFGNLMPALAICVIALGYWSGTATGSWPGWPCRRQPSSGSAGWPMRWSNRRCL